MDKAKLKEILDKHLKWVRGEHGGSRADLRGADLRGADLSGADLSGADLRGANLYGADLTRADLTRANLTRANLYGANLYGANLYGANLYGADLTRADLARADLSYAGLSSADLSGADLSRADLSGANIPVELVNKFYPLACPESGAFIGWKKCRDGLIVKLEVLETAKRSSAFGRKCRCSAAKVLCIENIDGTVADTAEAKSGRDADFIYRVGEIVSVDDFDEDRRNECSTGIHFFITRQEAVDYVL